MLPTAHTLELDSAAMPTDCSWMPGPAWIWIGMAFHFVPFQCSATRKLRLRAMKWPTAHAFFGEVAATPVRSSKVLPGVLTGVA